MPPVSIFDLFLNLKNYPTSSVKPVPVNAFLLFFIISRISSTYFFTGFCPTFKLPYAYGYSGAELVFWDNIFRSLLAYLMGCCSCIFFIILTIYHSFNIIITLLLFPNLFILFTALYIKCNNFSYIGFSLSKHLTDVSLGLSSSKRSRVLN